MSVAFFPVASADEIPPGKCLCVEVRGKQILIAHLEDGFFAIENRCSHAGNPLDARQIHKGAQVACPRHGARFDLRTGAAKSAPAYLSVATFPVRLNGAAVEIALPD